MHTMINGIVSHTITNVLPAGARDESQASFENLVAVVVLPDRQVIQASRWSTS
jgi:hypothetical protein